MSRKKDIPYTQLKRPVDLLFEGADTPDTDSNSEQAQSGEIAISKIQLPTSQPRRYFDPKKLEDLAHSIKEFGILEPLLVRPLTDGDYELVAGERRYKAALMAGLEQVPVVIRDMDDAIARQVRLVENLQREDLNPWEETEGILELLSIKLDVPALEVPRLLYRLQREQKKATNNRIEPSHEEAHNVMGNSESSAHNVMGNSELSEPMPETSTLFNPKLKIVEEVFAALGRMSWESFVKNRLPLLTLPQDIIRSLKSGQIEYTKAKVIARIPDEESRAEILSLAIKNNLSLTEIQHSVNAILKKTSEEKTSPLKLQYKELSKQLGTSKVWNDPKKRKSLEKLLAQIKAILSDNQNDQ